MAPNSVAAPVLTMTHRARAAADVRPEKHAVQALGQPGVRRRHACTLFDREAFARQDRFVDKEVRGFENHRVAGHQTTRLELHDVSGHELVGGQRRETALSER